MSSAVVDTDGVSFDALHGAVDEALDVDLTVRSDDGLLDALRELQRLSNRLASVEHALISEVDSRRICLQHLCSGTAPLYPSRALDGRGRRRELASGDWL